MMDPLSYFLSQPVLHSWCNKDCDIYYPVFGMVNIKNPVIQFENSSPCSGSSRFSLSLLNSPLLCIQYHITINKMC